MNMRMKPGALLAGIVIYGAAVIAFLPILWLVSTAFDNPAGYLGGGASFWPQAFTLDNFAKVFTPNILGKLANSIIVTAGATLLALVAGFPAAYALARAGWPRQLDKLFLGAVLLLKLTPPIALAVPLYQVLRLFGLLDTLPGLILVYQVYALPFAIWMLLGFIRDVPESYEEAAMLDGASLWQRLVTVVVPITAPGMAATAIFLVILCWNEFLYALLFIQSPSRFTLPTYIATLITEDQTYWGQLAAVGVLASLPVLLLVGAVQKALTAGFSGGLK